MVGIETSHTIYYDTEEERQEIIDRIKGKGNYSEEHRERIKKIAENFVKNKKHPKITVERVRSLDLNE